MCLAFCCSCNCCTFNDRFVRWMKEIFKLWIYLVFQTLMFIVLLSTCIGIAAVVSFFTELCSYRSLGPDFQAILTLCLLTCFGESMTLLVIATPLHPYYKQKRRQLPFLFVKLPFIIWFCGFVLALTQLYVQYQKAHPSAYFGNNDEDMSDDMIHPDTLNTKSTLIFLFSMSYLIYSVPIQSDWMRYRYRLTHMELLLQMGSCICYFLSLTLQIILLFLYSLVLVFLIIFTVSLKSSLPILTYFCVIVAAILLGKGSAEFEKCPVPVAPLLRPPYFYENYLAARVNFFQYILLPLVAFAYYGTGPISLLPADVQFLLYTFLISAAVFQASKSIFNTHNLVPHHRRHHHRNQGQQQRNEGLEALPELDAEAQLPSGNENHINDETDNNNNEVEVEANSKNSKESSEKDKNEIKEGEMMDLILENVSPTPAEVGTTNTNNQKNESQ